MTSSTPSPPPSSPLPSVPSAAATGIVGVFDRAADSYDAVGVPWFGPIARGLVDELAVRPGERVVDIGCGRGAALVPLAHATGPDGHALGLDLSPRMVELTARDVQDLPQVEVRVADASAPGLPAASYDVVASCLVLFFLPDAAAALRTWAQALVPGGRLGVTTFGPQDERWQHVDALFAPFLPPQVLEIRDRSARGPFASDESVERLLADAGLVDVRTTHRTVEARFSGPEQWLDFSWSHGQRALWEAVPQERHAEVREAAVERVQAFADGRGGLSFTQDVRHTLARRP